MSIEISNIERDPSECLCERCERISSNTKVSGQPILIDAGERTHVNDPFLVASQISNIGRSGRTLTHMNLIALNIDTCFKRSDFGPGQENSSAFRRALDHSSFTKHGRPEPRRRTALAGVAVSRCGVGDEEHALASSRNTVRRRDVAGALD
jgi:hypothetical protein